MFPCVSYLMAFIIVEIGIFKDALNKENVFLTIKL
jgi:hypothetical protein